MDSTYCHSVSIFATPTPGIPETNGAGEGRKSVAVSISPANHTRTRTLTNKHTHHRALTRSSAGKQRNSAQSLLRYKLKSTTGADVGTSHSTSPPPPSTKNFQIYDYVAHQRLGRLPPLLLQRNSYHEHRCPQEMKRNKKAPEKGPGPSAHKKGQRPPEITANSRPRQRLCYSKCHSPK